MAEHASGCLLCGAPLEYLTRAEPRSCALCGATRDADAACKAGHYVCDGCHQLGALDLIEQACVHATGNDPLRLAVDLMKSPKVHMHGPEHHFLVPAVLLSAFLNASGRGAEKEKLIGEAKRRAEAVKGGFCGFWGACGAAIGVGIFTSLVQGANPLSRAEWRSANAATARALAQIALRGGPRCCKRDTYLALRSAAESVRESLGVALELPAQVRCEFSARNQECLRAECPFFAPSL
jgi:hypothetical protein